LACCLGAALFLALGHLNPPPEVPSVRDALVRVALTVVTTVVFTLGPGLALSRVFNWSPKVGVSALAIPGFLLLGMTGLATWLLSHLIPPATTVTAILGVTLVALTIAAAWPGRRMGVRLDRGAAIVLLLLLLVVIGRDLYSLGPLGELYGGTISRTFEASNRPDSRISYHVVQLIANGINPQTTLGEANFRPYWFGSRGPLTGLMSAPIVIATGAKVPVGLPSQPWEPFDRQGFAAYRLAMEIFALAGLLSVFGLVGMLVGRAHGLFALGLVATTPFIVHEVYYTWPKLLTAGLLVLSAHYVLTLKPVRCAIASGLGYLAHPVALLSAPTIVLLTILARWRKDRRATAIAIGAYVLILVAFMAAWRIVNLSEPSQLGFAQYIFGSNALPTKSFSQWLMSRWQSLADTFLPLFVFFVHRFDPNLNPVYGPQGSRLIIFFLQYWTSFPFAAGILFSPLLVWGLVKAFRYSPRVVTSVVIIPVVLFAIYWGSYDTGLMREGLQPWMVSVLIVYAWFRGMSGWRSRVERWLLLTRIPETLAMMVAPAMLGHHLILSHQFPKTDAVGLTAMVVGLAGLGVAMWVLTRPDGRASNSVKAASATTVYDPEGIGPVVE
jgi:hypothetical protein